jgi:hypothetical protein
MGAMSALTNEASVRRAIEAIWNRGDLDVADELFASVYVNHDGLIVDLVGPESIKISAALYRLAFPDLYVGVEELTTEEDVVAVRWTVRSGSTGRAERSFLIANHTSLTGITHARLACGKIIETWTQWDFGRSANGPASRGIHRSLLPQPATPAGVSGARKAR